MDNLVQLPLERLLREQAARGELDLPVPHWHVERDAYPHERKPVSGGRHVRTFRTLALAQTYVRQFTQSVVQAAGKPPKRVCFGNQHIPDQNAEVTMVDDRRYTAEITACHKKGCIRGLGEMD